MKELLIPNLEIHNNGRLSNNEAMKEMLISCRNLGITIYSCDALEFVTCWLTSGSTPGKFQQYHKS